MSKTHKNVNRLLAMILSIAMVLTLTPVSAFGTDKVAEKATVSFTAQVAGSFMCAPQMNVEVSSDLAESYGYDDKIKDKVSALDVLVKAHETIFAEAFTKADKDDYLSVGSTGFVTKIFGVETGANGFMINGMFPHDGKPSIYGSGYNGTTVNTTPVNTGDILDFFIYQDSLAYSDLMSWFEKDGKYVSTVDAEANEEVELAIKGFYHMNGYIIKDVEELHNFESAQYIEGAEFKWVNISTGELTNTGVFADENGKGIIKMPAEAGTYYLTANGDAEEMSACVMSLLKVNVIPADSMRVEITILGDTKHYDADTGEYTGEHSPQMWIDAADEIIPKDSTAQDLLKKVLDAKYGKNYNMNEWGYVSSINGLNAFDNGPNSGWMILLNGKLTQEGNNTLKLKGGDHLTCFYSDDYTKETGDVAAEVGDVIILINKIGYPITADSKAAITAARTAYDALTDEQKKDVSNYSSLTWAEADLQQILKKNASHKEIYDNTGKRLAEMAAKEAPTVGSIGGDWLALGLARSGKDVPKDYYKNVVKYVDKAADKNGRIHRSKSTDNSRVILALTAIGRNPADVAGNNLLMGLTDMEYVKKQGINGPIWALIAFDSNNYKIPENSAAKDQTSREKLIKTILDAQLADGGWALSGDKSDPDITAMALQALAPYYNKNDNVKAAVDKAVNWLSTVQVPQGFGNCESTAQVVIALSSLNINPATDYRFVKNGTSVVDALCSFSLNDGKEGFEHISGQGFDNQMATEQAYNALTSYYRMLNKESRLYDMTKVALDNTYVDVTSDAEKAPQTGDKSNIYFWIILLIGATFVIPAVRKKHHK